MKKIFALSLVSIFMTSAAYASEFCDGFQRGYATGYQRAKNTNMAPMQPMCPMQPMKRIGDPQSDFEQGYLIGLSKGLGS